MLWNSRLLLFWLRIVKTTPQAAPDPGTAPAGAAHVADMTMTDVRTAVKTSSDNDVNVRIGAVLCWSEFYNGKWQPSQTSDINAPVDLGAYSPAEAASFDRSGLSLWSDEPAEGLRITIRGGLSSRAFRLYNTHSQPEPMIALSTPFGRHRYFGGATNPFVITYTSAIPDVPPASYACEVLTDSIPITAVQPSHLVSNPWTSAFFFEDRRNVFYVTSAEDQVWVIDFHGYGHAPTPSFPPKTFPPIVIDQIPRPVPIPWVVDPINPGVKDIGPISRFIERGQNITRGIGAAATVQYGDIAIGPAGAIKTAAAIEQN